MSPIIGITTCNPAYEALAIEAARRFRHYTGCDCIILTANDGGFDLMLEAVRVAHGRVFCLFDADLWFIRHTSLDQFIGMEGLAAVADPAALHDTFCRRDAETIGFLPERYVNTGLIFANSADSRVILAFDRASVMHAEKKAGLWGTIEDHTEQSILNAALHEQGLPTQFLPQAWNVYTHAARYNHVDTLPAQPIAIHAAGVPLDKKMHRLGLECATFEYR